MNETETHVYLTKCNLGMRIKCMGPTQFENKEWESHSHVGVENENEIMRMEYMFTFYPSNFFIVPKLPSFKSQLILLFKYH
ncbi:hypothetical protein WN944_004190 [Citrus x changshan-huyou]|uniref:Uncharacterized protein n=1 Tax=Citrus x changshan-huyou TaxID=2935761 RepID=A0AAP0M0P0_9ROSI